MKRISHVGVFDGKAIPLCTSLRSEANIRWVQNACGPWAGAPRRQRGKKQMLGRALISAVLWGGLITVALTGPAAAADAATVVTADSSPRSCLRWVWQERSWYDDCWARRPYPVRR